MGKNDFQRLVPGRKQVKKRIFKSCCLFLVLIGLGIAGLWFYLFWEWRLEVEQVAPQVAAPIQLTQGLEELSPAIVQRMQEITVLVSPGEAGSIVALFQPPQGEHLLALYANGLFRRWGFNTQETLAEYDFISASIFGGNFTTDGGLAVTPGEVLSEGVVGYNVWETQSGERIVCDGVHCHEDDVRIIHRGLLLDPERKFIVEYGETIISIRDIPLTVRIGWNIDYQDDHKYEHISMIAMDPSGTYFAYALEEGTVTIYKFVWVLGQESIPWFTSDYGLFRNWLGLETLDLEFDYTRRWLGQLTENDLRVWSLKKYTLPRQMQIPVSDGNVIAFDRRGEILAVGTDTGIMLFDIEKSRPIFFLDVGHVTALYFTRDNRLLLWGGMEGEIHVMGVLRDD